MKIVQVGGESETPDSAPDVRLDVESRAGNTTVAKGVKSTLGSNFVSLETTVGVSLLELT